MVGIYNLTTYFKRSIFLHFEILLIHFFRLISCCNDCFYAGCTVIGATFCIITFPAIVYGCMDVIFQPEASACYIMAVILIIYIILARAVILGF